MAAAKSFAFDYKGSVILRDWMAQRAIAKRQRQQMRSGFGPVGGFAGAAVGRLTASLAQWSGSVNADLDIALPILRARARALCANTWQGRRFLSMVATNVIGGDKHPRLQVRAYNIPVGKAPPALDKPANDAIEQHWLKWAKRCDLTGKMSLPHMLRVIVKSLARDGESVVRKVRDKALPYGFAIQLLESDRIADGLNQRLRNGNTIRQGVEIDSRSVCVALHLHTTHPGENYASAAERIERVPIGDVYHLFLQERAEQLRGYSWLHAVLNRSGMLDGFEDAAVVAARIGASKVGVFEKSLDAYPGGVDQMAEGVNAGGKPQMNAEPGEFFELPPGYTLNQWNPEYPHANFDAFLKACLRGIASGLDVAAHNLTGDMTGVNYSSARIAELAEREMWIMVQDWFFGAFLQPLFSDWLDVAMLLGAITFDSGAVLPYERLDRFRDAAMFQGRRWPWVDPLKDGKAATEQLNSKLKSRTSIAAENGENYEDILYEIAQENQLAKDIAGLDLTAPLGGAAPAAAADAEDDADEEGDATEPALQTE